MFSVVFSLASAIEIQGHIFQIFLLSLYMDLRLYKSYWSVKMDPPTEIREVSKRFQTFFRYLQTSSTETSVPALEFPRRASHLRSHPCNCYLLWLCPPCNQGCAVELPVVMWFWAPFNSRTSQCLSVTGVQVVTSICTCSVLYSVGSWILPRMETTQPLWATCSSAWPVKKFIPMSSWSPSCFNWCFCVSSFCHEVLRRSWLHLLGNLLTGIEKLPLGPPKAASSPGWTSPLLSASPHPASALALWPAWWTFCELT